MKITKQQLRRVIQEELTQLLREQAPATTSAGPAVFQGREGDPYEYTGTATGGYQARKKGSQDWASIKPGSYAHGSIAQVQGGGQAYDPIEKPAAAQPGGAQKAPDYGQQTVSDTGGVSGGKFSAGPSTGMHAAPTGTTTYAGPGRRRQAVKDLGGPSKAGRKTVRQAIRGKGGAAQTARQQRQDRKGGLRRDEPLSKLGRRTLTLPSAE